MKMQYSRRRNALISKRTLVVGTSISLLCLLIFSITSFFPSLPLLLAQPGWNIGAAASNATHSLSFLFEDTNKALTERDRLLEENRILNNENRVLRAQQEDIAYLTGEGTPRIVAGVLARPPVSPYDTLIISLGEISQVPLGSFVYGAGGVPLGKIDSSGKGTARVLLYSSPSSKVEGWIGTKRLPVTLVGESAGAFSATLARASGVLVGDVLYLPGPGALPAGTVARVESDPSSTEDIVFIVPYVNIFSITWVSIDASHE